MEFTKEEIERKKRIPVKDRDEEDHLALVKEYGGVRNYLLSMGEFKELKIEEMGELDFLKWIFTEYGSQDQEIMVEIDKRIARLNTTSEGSD